MLIFHFLQPLKEKHSFSVCTLLSLTVWRAWIPTQVGLWSCMTFVLTRMQTKYVWFGWTRDLIWALGPGAGWLSACCLDIPSKGLAIQIKICHLLFCFSLSFEQGPLLPYIKCRMPQNLYFLYFFVQYHNIGHVTNRETWLMAFLGMGQRTGEQRFSRSFG